MALIVYGTITIDLPDDDALDFYVRALRHLNSGKVSYMGLSNHGEAGDRIVTISPGVPLAVEFQYPLTDEQRAYLQTGVPD
jgi:hypothetical protein